MICEVKDGYAAIVSEVGKWAGARVSHLPAAFGNALTADGRYRVTLVTRGGIALGVTWTPLGYFPAKWSDSVPAPYRYDICRDFLRSIGVRVRHKGQSTIRLKVEPMPCPKTRQG